MKKIDGDVLHFGMPERVNDFLPDMMSDEKSYIPVIGLILSDIVR
jgi:hypothetical protein